MKRDIRLTGSMVRLAWGLVWLCGGATAAGSESKEDADLAESFGPQATISLATGSSQLLRRAPAVATVITAQDIAALGATTLEQLLETVPGLHVAINASSYDPIYVMRGIYGVPTNPQVLLMSNGVPLSSVYSGDRGGSWGGLPLENVARIEIMRGPASALYGADAFAGIINVISKSAAELSGTRLGARAGSFNAWDTWAQYGGRLGDLQAAAYLRAGATDGQREIVGADAASRLDALFGTHASRAPGPVNTGHRYLDAALDLQWGGWRMRGSLQERPRGQFGAGVNSALDPNSYTNGRRSSTELSWADATLTEAWGAGVSFSQTRFRELTPLGIMLFPPGTRIGSNLFPDGMIGGPNRWQRQNRLSAFATFSGWSGHALRLGLGHEDLYLYATRTNKNFILSPTGVPIPTGPVIDYSEIQPHVRPTRRLNNYVYIQDEWQLAPDWIFTAGLRHDKYSDFGSSTNPRLALVWDVTYNLTAKLLHGQAFRAPSFNEQYGLNPVNNGNPNIMPERMRTSELALDWQARRELQFRLSLFDYLMSDIIRTLTNAPPATGSSYQNTGRQRGRGFELEANWEARRDLRLVAQVSQQRSFDADTGLDAGYAPHQHWFARADWRFSGDWQLGGQFNAVKDRRRSAADPRAPVADYSTLDLNLRRTTGLKGLEITLALRNVFNADVREPSQAGGTLPNDLPQARRNGYVEGRYSF